MTPTTATDRYCQWTRAGLDDRPIEREDARAILRGEEIDLAALLSSAGAVRQRYFGDTVTIHILDNVRNGACLEDCGYCGQSAKSSAPIRPYKLKSVEQIVAQARDARSRGAYRFCMALAGRGPGEREIEHMSRAIEQISGMGLRTCLSAGLLDEDKARRLKQAGLDRLNHNLNTSASHYPAICSTHTYEDRVRTLKAAKEQGLGLCSGVIVGMNETHEDLLDVAYALREIRTESLPVNFLLPIEGNRVSEPRCEGRPLDPRLALRVLCMFRLTNPTAELRIAAGREFHLRSLQPMGLWPANSLFMEGYLLTQGQQAQPTLQMILDAGFTPALEDDDHAPELKRWIERYSKTTAQDGSTPLTGGGDGDGEQGRGGQEGVGEGEEPQPAPAALKDSVMSSR